MEFVVANKYLKKRPPAIKHFKKLKPLKGRADRVRSASAAMTTTQTTPPDVRSFSSATATKSSRDDCLSTPIKTNNKHATNTDVASVVESTAIMRDILTSPSKNTPTYPANDFLTSAVHDSVSTADEFTSSPQDTSTSPVQDSPSNHTHNITSSPEEPTATSTHVTTSPTKDTHPYVMISHGSHHSKPVAKPAIPKTAPAIICRGTATLAKIKATSKSAMPSLELNPTFLEVKRLIVNKGSQSINSSSEKGVTATKQHNNAGKKCSNRTNSNKRQSSERCTNTHADNEDQTNSEYSIGDGSLLAPDDCTLLTPALPLLHARTAPPAAAGSLTVAGYAISPSTHTDRDNTRKIIKTPTFPEPLQQPPQQLRKIDYTKSNSLFTAISNFERRQHSQLQANFWDQQASATRKAYIESKRQKELVRMHRTALRSEMMELAKSYSMYYSHLRLQDFQGWDYKPSLRVAWYSKYCNHVQMKEDFREDAQKVMEDWLLEKTFSLNQK